MKLAEQEADDDAILLCRRAIGIKPDFVPAYAFLGEMYERVGEREKALEAYEKALALDKDYEPAKVGRDRISKTPKPKLQPSSVTDVSVSLWAGHPLPLLAATALIVAALLAVRAFVPPPIRPESPSAQPPITISPALSSQHPTMTAPPMPPVVKELIRKGSHAFNEGKYDEAISWFGQALSHDPNNSEARSLLLLAQASAEERRLRRQAAARTAPITSVLPTPSTSAFPSSQPSVREQPVRKPQITYLPPISPPTWAQRTQPMPPQGSAPTTQQTMPSTMPHTTPSTHPYAGGVSHIVQPRQGTYVSPITPSQGGLAGSPPSPTPPPPSIEDLEHQAITRTRRGDLDGAAQIYRAILSRGVSVEQEGSIRQRLALTLQQLERYDEAADEYERAIAAYSRQIERRIEVEVAKRGIEACQRGLEICRRSR